MSAAADLRPGYLVVSSDTGGTYVGGLMITDGHGLPVDFRYTDPITPTRLQRALYGGALDRYLRADVVAATLLKAVDERPTVLLVDDDNLVDAVRADCPVVAVLATNLPPIGECGTVRGEQDGALVQAVHGAAPVRVSARGGLEDAPAFVATLGETMDPMEPVRRVRAALDLIAAGEAA